MDPHSPPPEGLSPLAWQPFTFSGVAAFAAASFTRLIAVGFAAAVLIASGAVACLYWTWGPALDEAIHHLPPTGEIRDGRLIWPETAPTRLVDNQFLALIVQRGAAKPGQSADVQIELGDSAAILSSLLGYVVIDYPAGSTLPLNRTETEPLWGAWRPYLHLGAGIVLVGALALLWALLASALVLPLRFYTFLADRRATCAACWRLAVASLIPGGMLMGTAILFYGLRRLTLVDLLLINAIHLFVGLVYLLIAPLRLPRRAPPSGSLPDQPSPSSNSPATQAPPATSTPSAPAEANPFKGVASSNEAKRGNPFAGG